MSSSGRTATIRQIDRLAWDGQFWPELTIFDQNLTKTDTPETIFDQS